MLVILFLSLVVSFIAAVIFSIGYMFINKINNKLDFMFESLILSFCFASFVFCSVALVLNFNF